MIRNEPPDTRSLKRLCIHIVCHGKDIPVWQFSAIHIRSLYDLCYWNSLVLLMNQTIQRGGVSKLELMCLICFFTCEIGQKSHMILCCRLVCKQMAWWLWKVHRGWSEDGFHAALDFWKGEIHPRIRISQKEDFWFRDTTEDDVRCKEFYSNIWERKRSIWCPEKAPYNEDPGFCRRRVLFPESDQNLWDFLL